MATVTRKVMMHSSMMQHNGTTQMETDMETIKMAPMQTYSRTTAVNGTILTG